MNSKKSALLVIFGLLILGAGACAFYTKKMNAVGFRGLPVTVKGLEKEVVNDWLHTFDAILQRDDVLQIILKESEYAAKLGLSEGEALEHLRGAVEATYSEKSGLLLVGLRGKRKNQVELDAISQTIFNVAAPGVAQLKPAFAAHYQSILESR